MPLAGLRDFWGAHPTPPALETFALTQLGEEVAILVFFPIAWSLRQRFCIGAARLPPQIPRV